MSIPNGTVTISLQEYHRLIDDRTALDNEAQTTLSTSKEVIDMMGDLLQFLGSKQYFEDFAAEYNAADYPFKIKREPSDNRVKMYYKGEVLRGKDNKS